MLLTKQINSWFTKAKQYFFTYKEGFFELSYLSNSPEAIVASFGKMPFVKHNKEEQYFTSKNPFSNGVMHYQELEEGLWLVYAESEYKANVLFKPYFDLALPRDYYFLSYNIDINEVEEKATSINHYIEFTNRWWVLFKPETTVNLAHFKHTKTTNLSVYFNKEWLQKNLRHDKKFADSRLPEFFDSGAQYLIWPDDAPQPFDLLPAFQKEILVKGSKGIANVLKVKMLVISLFETFVQKHTDENIATEHFEIPNTDRLRVMKIEHHLTHNLLQKFEGIEELSYRFSISPTKLKNDFKLIFGKPVYQYYQEKQMQLAAEIIKTEDIRIKELATRMGYENTGKFSLAFKKYNKVLPSQFLQQETA